MFSFLFNDSSETPIKEVQSISVELPSRTELFDKALEEAKCVAARVVAPVVGAIFLATFISALDLMVWLAPKVWLIKEIATLIK